MIYYIPIEPLEERYTEQWYRWFPEEFVRQGLNFAVIDGQALSDVVETGTFLDINSTLHYKAEQLKTIAKLFYQKRVSPGDQFFVADTEFWGIESIRYLSDLNRVPVRIVGFAHAGSYTKGDFVEPCAEYASLYEEGWGRVFDRICVGSEYHRLRLASQRRIDLEKIVVTGNPYDVNQVKDLVRKPFKIDRVIHTNRPDPEKDPHSALTAIDKLHSRNPEWEFLLTTGRKKWGQGEIRDRALHLQKMGVLRICEGISKLEYFRLLAGAKVMTGNSPEENFGYCILEAMAFDTIPVLPNVASHPELVQGDDRCLFEDVDEQVELVEYAMDNPFKVFQYARKYENSLARVVKEIVGD